MNGLHELPLIIFTVLAQSTVGAWLLFSWALYRNNSAQSKQYLHKVMFILLALLGLGFIASILHLGSPLRAFNSLNRIGSSMLSNEIASGAVFFGAAGIYWLLGITGKITEALAKVWLALTAVLGLVFMYMMNNVYHINTVPTWDSLLTSLQFYLTLVIGGSALAYGLLNANPHKTYKLCHVAYCYLVGLFLAVIVVIYQGVGLAHIHSSVQQAVNLVPDFANLQALRFTLLALGAIVLCKLPKNWLLGVAALAVLFAEMIGRLIFYGLHMTVGMAVAG
ncbi:anaerobic dimethyl sulfoxide reductase subunit C (anchor subunit) [Mesocricetibacter intestinalis]|uniref:Anaerobic dimethyl sulfoxide reductase subunit C (Anchor subunit) n=1 Tax=Mesocricetibacter intestinalis TaxID=1521930 RepID=A0A4R6VBE2_9PAST|nr:DmsC/YnfH family molybdoenzyme membrane anchor subunit [Mesocricetibacter intestinalis]TDQ59578.1 anaerobic dimethyl sulfoxide reductase subunit C (anchor subunit) [Mesocricetibacter intestinalis]